jgi:hypothetical protein
MYTQTCMWPSLTFKHLSLGTKVCNPYTKETGVNFLQPGHNSLLQVHICCKSLASQMLLQGSRETEITGCEVRTACKAVHNLTAIVLSLVTSWLAVCGPALCIYLDVLGSIWLAAICNRCKHEASCHLLPTDTWHVFLLCQDTSPAATMKKCSNVNADFMHVTYAMCTLKSEWSSHFHKLPHTNNQTRPHTINIRTTHYRIGHCDSPWEVRNWTLWCC